MSGILAATLGGLVGIVPPLIAVTVVACVAAVALLREFGLVSLPLPENRRQVPQYVTRLGPAMGALQFGFELGTGVRTYMTASAPYVLLVGVIFWGDMLAGLATGLGFGLGRAAMPITRRLSGDLSSWDARLFRQLAAVTRGCLIVLVAALAVLAVQIAPWTAG